MNSGLYFALNSRFTFYLFTNKHIYIVVSTLPKHVTLRWKMATLLPPFLTLFISMLIRRFSAFFLQINILTSFIRRCQALTENNNIATTFSNVAHINVGKCNVDSTFFSVDTTFSDIYINIFL